MIRRVVAACVAAVVAVAWACGGGSVGSAPPPPDEKPQQPAPNPGTPGAGTPGAGTPGAGTPGAGTPTDSGTPTDGGGTPVPAGPGPWPNETRINFTQRYNLGHVQSMGVDDAYNLWLLDGARIGVLRPGDSAPRWVSNLGQAAQGFGPDALAEDSTVICGGSAGRAYVGYAAEEMKADPDAPEMDSSYIVGPGECYQYDPTKPCAPYKESRWKEFQKGDLDVVKLDGAGTISLETHLGNSVGFGYKNIGIRNSNDWHYDEDRSVLVCKKVMRGKFKGELYVGTNHGVTRIRGLDYDAHRHPVWDVNGSLRIGYNYGLGIARNGDLLIANEWKIGALTPPDALGDYDNTQKVPFLLNTYVDALNDLPTMDKWRGFEQTVDGRYYLGSIAYGVWQMTVTVRADGQWQPKYQKLTGPAELENVNALAATDDGSLFIATDKGGLWRLDAQKQLKRVDGIDGSSVKELLYDPTVNPAMLWVLTDKGITVLRGY